jgi:hypothetical protein
MTIVEGILSTAIYDGLKFGGKLLLGPYYKTFQKAQKKAQKQLKQEFSEGELLSILRCPPSPLTWRKIAVGSGFLTLNQNKR